MPSDTPAILEAFFAQLRKTEPIADRYDVEWWGPYFIPRPGRWHRTHFLLYGGKLHGTLELGWSVAAASLDLGTGEVSPDHGPGTQHEVDDERLWEQALAQLTARLRSALANPARFNQRVARQLPLASRTGHLRRRLTWPRGRRPPLSRAELAAVEHALVRGGKAASWSTITVNRYLGLLGRMYDAAFPELRGLPALEQRARKADTRHGGLLELPKRDAAAFAGWLTSNVWAGTHPWEIVYGYPHGILFSPWRQDDDRWRFHLSVDTLGLYLEAVRMAVALGAAGAPFGLHDQAAVIAALRGTDAVEVGPGFGQIALDELAEIRPGSLEHIGWDPVAEIRPITPAQAARVEHVLRTGRPPIRE
jgi:hypothetical protein